MKKIKRILFGVISSLLFAVGFARAADHLDPLSTDLAGKRDHHLEATPDCTSVCDTAAPDCTSVCDSL